MGMSGALLMVVPVLIGVVVAIIVVVVVTRLVRAGVAHRRNAALPEESVAARVVGRRTQTEGGGRDRMVRTTCFVTFETVDGGRLELRVPDREYGQLAEGDEGHLTHQGTWYRGFERRRVIPLDGTWEAPGGPSMPPPDAPEGR